MQLFDIPILGSLWTRFVRGTWSLFAEADWQRFVGDDNPERILVESVLDREHRKQGRAIGRWTLTRQGDKLVVFLKRHYRLPRWQGLWATLFPWRAWSPGLQEWNHLQWAKSAGLPVPRAVAVGERVGPWGQLQSFLAVEELEDQLPLHEAIPLAQASMNAELFIRWKQGLIREMARLSHLLHDRNRFHKDLYLCHFYIREADTKQVPTDWQHRVTMIDFHRLGHHPFLRWWYQIKDLGQLLYSSEVPGVTAKDRLRFWKVYVPNQTRWHHLLAWAIRWKWTLYRRHNQRRVRNQTPSK